MLNHILNRQIKKYLDNSLAENEGLSRFLLEISSTYNQFEQDRKITEQSMQISSEELTIANKKLREEADETKQALNKLYESLKLLQDSDKISSSVSYKNLNLLDVANIIRKESEQRKIAENKLKENLNNLEKINRELDQFAYIASHDLKAPLRAIASLADWIKEDSADELTVESINNLELLRGRVTRMESLIHGILAYSKAGKIRTETTLVNVKEMLFEIIDSLNPSLSFSINIPTDLPVIETEATKLQQVFANLISNSIKYMDKPNGIINIGCLQMDDTCQFFVEDNGPGIEKEYHERIFQLFQTLYTRDEVESTGIGLSIVKKIIEEQKGKIWVESEKGKGSKFIFTWPSVTNVYKKTVK
jgi:signal transduction histidine kinase